MDWPRALKYALVRRNERDWRFALSVTAAFALLQLLGHTRHEMWRDELHCWAVGRNASGLWDLLTGERRYDGHPFLWYYLLHLASRVTRSYVALQVIAWCLSVVAAGLWMRHAPVPRGLRVGLLGSHYLLFEYGVMCRSYTLGVVLTFTFCALYRPYCVRYVALGFVLALLSATSLYGMLVSLALAAFLFFRGPMLEEPDTRDPRSRLALPLAWTAGMLVLLAGVTLTVLTSWPPADAYYGPRALADVDAATIGEALGRYWHAMFPFNRWLDWMWSDETALGRRLVVPDWMATGLGAAWLLLWLAAFRRVPRVMICYALGVVLISAGQHFIYAGGLRHVGHIFILTVTCLWLFATETRGRTSQRLLHTLFAVSVAAQAVTGAIAFRTDFRAQFSGSLDAARFIRASHLESLPVVADPDDPTTPVAVILDRPFFFPVTGETTDATVFHARRVAVTQEALIEHARRLAQGSAGASLVVTNYDVQPPSPTAGLVLTLLHRGAPSLVSDESLLIYLAHTR